MINKMNPNVVPTQTLSFASFDKVLNCTAFKNVVVYCAAKKVVKGILYPRYVPVDAIWTLTRESVFFCKLNRYFDPISSS